MNITPDILRKIAPQANAAIIEGLARYLTIVLPDYDIASPKRVLYFLGQAAEETAGFKTLVEYASGKEYEGRHDLGNDQPGDGVRYKGRGIFQLTGKSNYRHIGEVLGLDLLNHPELAADPKVAVLTACIYWNERKLSDFADVDDIVNITRRINGGLNGFEDRKTFTARAKAQLPAIFA